MMTMINPASAAAGAAIAKPKTGLAALGAADFVKLMTAQLQQQDPTKPVDNTQMLAQLAQFSTLSATADVNTTLKDISTKLDAVLAARSAASPAPAA